MLAQARLCNSFQDIFHAADASRSNGPQFTFQVNIGVGWTHRYPRFIAGAARDVLGSPTSEWEADRLTRKTMRLN